MAGAFQFAPFDSGVFDVDDPHVDGKLAPSLTTTAPINGRRIPRGKLTPAVVFTAPIKARRIPRGKITPAVSTAVLPKFFILFRHKIAAAAVFAAPIKGRRIPRGKLTPAAVFAAPIKGRRIPRGKLAPALTTTVQARWRILPKRVAMVVAAVFTAPIKGYRIARGYFRADTAFGLFARGSRLWDSRPEQIEIWTTRPEQAEPWNLVANSLAFEGNAFDLDVFAGGFLNDGAEEWAPMPAAGSGWAPVSQQQEIWTRVRRHG